MAAMAASERAGRGEGGGKEVGMELLSKREGSSGGVVTTDRASRNITTLDHQKRSLHSSRAYEAQTEKKQWREIQQLERKSIGRPKVES